MLNHFYMLLHISMPLHIFYTIAYLYAIVYVLCFFLQETRSIQIALYSLAVVMMLVTN